MQRFLCALLLLLTACESHLVEPRFTFNEARSELELAWQNNPGPVGGRWSAIVADPRGQLFAATLEGWVFRSNDYGASWHPVYNARRGGSIGFLEITPEGVLVLGTDLGVMVSNDEGATWTAVPLEGVPDGTTGVATLDGAVDAAGTVLVAYVTGLARLDLQRGAAVPLPGFPEIPVALTAGKEAGVFYAGGQPTGHGYRSDDGGQTWTQVFDSGPDAIRRLTVSPTGRVFLGMNLGGIIHRDGDRWVKSLPGLDQGSTLALATGPGGDVWAGRSADVFYSPDDGETWIQTNLTGRGVLSLAVHPFAGVFAGTLGEGVFSTMDSGVTWSQLRLTNTVVGALLTADGVVFASTPNSGVFRSETGADWENINTVSQLRGFTFGARLYDLIETADQGLLIGSTAGAYHTMDQGRTWTYIGPRLTTVRSLVQLPSGRLLAGTSRNGVGRYENESWSASGLEFRRVSTLRANSKGQVFAGTADAQTSAGFRPASGLYRSDDEGETWQQLDEFGGESFEDFFVGADDVLYASTFEAMYRSNDDGQTWRRMEGAGSDALLLALLLTSDGTLYAGYELDGLWRSVDRGVTWARVDQTFTNLPIQSLAEWDAETLLVGTFGSGVNVYKR